MWSTQLQSKKAKKWYVGFTICLRKRFKEQNDNLILSSTFWIPCGLAAGLPDGNSFSRGLIPREKVLDLFTSCQRQMRLWRKRSKNFKFD